MVPSSLLEPLAETKSGTVYEVPVRFIDADSTVDLTSRHAEGYGITKIIQTAR